MGFLRIHCDSCGGTWDVYGRDNWKESRCRTCPHCQSEIDGQDWERFILPAFGGLMDANRELMKTHTGYSTPLFAVDYIEDHSFSDKTQEAKAAAADLQSSVEELRETVEQLAAVIIAAALKGDENES